MHWKKLFTYIFVWFAVEIVFNLLEIDNLADYGEFVLSRNLNLVITQARLS